MKSSLRTLFLGVLLFFASKSFAQMNEELPLKEIPKAPEKFTASTVVCRMIEGVGFRYYWATEGLRSEDLDYKPSAEARTSRETLDHIYGLSQTILSAARNIPNNYDDGEGYEFSELRERTLRNFKEASMIFRNDPEADLNTHNAIFQRDGKTTEYPFWNMINGPIEDAAWHVGQIVSFRRSSGNSFDSKASLFSGKLRN